MYTLYLIFGFLHFPCSSQRQESHSINNIAILHPRKLVIYSLVTTSGFAEHGNLKFGFCVSFTLSIFDGKRHSVSSHPVCYDIRDNEFSKFSSVSYFPSFWLTTMILLHSSEIFLSFSTSRGAIEAAHASTIWSPKVCIHNLQGKFRFSQRQRVSLCNVHGWFFEVRRIWWH